GVIVSINGNGKVAFAAGTGRTLGSTAAAVNAVEAKRVGRGAFAAGSNITSDADATTSLAVGDLDGDDDLDLLVGNDGQSNKIYLNNGAAVFTADTAGMLPADTDHTTAVVIADFNGDHHPDIVT